MRKPFEDQEGWRPQHAPSELLRQLGYIGSYAQPDFRPSRGGGGLGIADGIENMVRASALGQERQAQLAERGTMADIEGTRLQRERIEAAGVSSKDIAKNDPRGTMARIFDTMIAGGGRAAQRLGEPGAADMAGAAEMRKAQAQRTALQSLYPDPTIDPAVLEQARTNPQIAGGLADSFAQERDFVNRQSKALAQEPVKQTAAELAFSQMYTGQFGAAGQALTRGVGKAETSSLIGALRNPKLATALLGTLPKVDEVGPAGVDQLVYGDTRPGFDYEQEQDRGVFFRLARGEGNQKWKGQEWNLSFADKEGQDTLKAFRDEMGPLFAEADGEASEGAAASAKSILDSGSGPKRSRPKIDPYAVADEFEYLAMGVPYDRKAKHSEEALGTARMMYDRLFAPGRSPILTNKDGSKVIPLTDPKWKGEFLRPTLDPTFEFMGETTAAKQAGLNPGEMKQLANLIGSSYDKALGSNGRMIESWMQGELTKRGITDERNKELTARAMPLMRQMWIENGYGSDKRPFSQIAASELNGALDRYLQREKVTTYNGMTPAQKGHAVVQDTEDERDVEKQQFFGQPGLEELMQRMGNSGMQAGPGPATPGYAESQGGNGTPGEPGDWLLEEEAAREKFAYPGPQQIDGGRELGRLSNAQQVSNIRGKKAARKADPKAPGGKKLPAEPSDDPWTRAMQRKREADKRSGGR